MSTQREQIIQLAVDELEHPSMAVTRQYLEVFRLVRDARGRPIVARSDEESTDGTAVVYFAVEAEHFFLAVCVKPSPQLSVAGVYVEPGNAVYFQAISDVLDFAQLSAATSIRATDGWTKGEARATRPWKPATSSAFLFEPNPERADELEDKLRKLLDALETDAQGIKWLSEHANAEISVAWYSYFGNGNIGGIHLSRDLIARLAKLGLEVDFDLYTGGEPFS